MLQEHAHTVHFSSEAQETAEEAALIGRLVSAPMPSVIRQITGTPPKQTAMCCVVRQEDTWLVTWCHVSLYHVICSKERGFPDQEHSRLRRLNMWYVVSEHVLCYLWCPWQIVPCSCVLSCSWWLWLDGGAYLASCLMVVSYWLIALSHTRIHVLGFGISVRTELELCWLRYIYYCSLY